MESHTPITDRKAEDTSMNEKEIAEIRRTLTPGRTNVTRLCGCYINATGEIIARFNQSFGLMQEEESEKFLSLFRRTLSGTVEKNLLSIGFSSNQVLNGEEYALLEQLRRTELSDDRALDTFFTKVAQSMPLKENYAVLLTHNRYDVLRKRGAEGGGEESAEVYSYILCSICPVRTRKSMLAYLPERKSFGENHADSVITAPELGFLFPAFDGRQTNIYNALFYTRSAAEAHSSFTDTVFRRGIAMPAAEQGETFQRVLADALSEDCSFRVARALHEQLCEKIAVHKETRSTEPLIVTEGEFREVLEECGVPEEKVNAFAAGYDESFGQNTELPPKNIVDPRRFELRTPDVIIRVAPGCTHLIETRRIGGVKYILIRAEEGAELNGLNIHIEE